MPVFVQAQFLLKGGVRNAALGGTGIVSSNDLSAAIWNPALLGGLDRIELITDRRQFFWNLDNDNLAFNCVSVGYPFGNYGTLALSTSFINAAHYGENKIGIHYGNSLFQKRLSLGFSVYNYQKGYESYLYTENDPFYEEFGFKKSNFDFDLGIALQINKNFNIGFIAGNILKADLALNPNDSDFLPLSYGTGLMYNWKKVTLICDFLFETYEKNKKNELLFASGIEYKMTPKMVLRFGNNNYNMTAGFGLKLYSKEWSDKFVDPFTSVEFVNIKGFEIIMDYGVQYPLSGLISSYGDHFLGIKINFFNSTTEVDKLKDKVPPRIETQKVEVKVPDYITKIKQDTVYTLKVKIDTLIKKIVMRDTVRIYDNVPSELLLKSAKELEATKNQLAGMRNWNRALTHLLIALKYYYSEQFDKAINECQNAIKIAPKLTLAYVRLGSIYYRIGDINNAKRYWKMAKRIEPENAELKKIPEKYFN